MDSNQGVAYIGPGNVELRAIDFPVLALGNRRCDHGAILRLSARISAAATSTW